MTALQAPTASAGGASACPLMVGKATRLFVGVAPGMASSTGHAQLFQRNGVKDQWQVSGTRLPVTFGRNGLGWSYDQTDLARTVGAARSGACIFLHVWRGSGRATSGCVAMSESNVTRVQHFFDGQPSALVLIPQSSSAILSQCALPALQATHQ
jgi:hypothetical protein